MRSTTQARLALCRVVRDWPMDALSHHWLQWCRTRSFKTVEQMDRAAGRVNLRRVFARLPD